MEESVAEYSLRPLSLDEFIGQKKCVDNLKVFIDAALTRRQAMDHTLLHGPPGLGKTTLATLSAKHLGVNFRIMSGATITRAGDLAAQLTSLSRGDVLFIDEVHRLPASAAEMLYPAMEDFGVDIIVGEGPHARAIRIDLEPFTLIAATTRSGLLPNPLRDRFGIILHMDYYDKDSLTTIVMLGAEKLGVSVAKKDAELIACRSRGTPRLALRLLKRARDFADYRHTTLNSDIIAETLSRLEIDERGLDKLDRRYLSTLAEKFAGGPTGIGSIAAAMAEERDLIEDVVEPYLMQNGFIARTARGRILVNKD